MSLDILVVLLLEKNEMTNMSQSVRAWDITEILRMNVEGN